MATPSSDPILTRLLNQEEDRQNTTLSLIASENYAPAMIRDVEASVLMNKYAEGYPGKRYYAGCEIIDQIEQLTIDRAQELFGAEHANVQPHAGSQANFAVYVSILKPGDTIMGMSLSSGGHLTHGHKVNLSGILYNAVTYDVDPETELIDYTIVEELARQYRPTLIIAGASAYSRIIDFERFAHIARSINAFLLADISHIAGLVAARLHPSPVPYADFVTSTTHKSLRGPRGAFILCKKEHQAALDRAVMPGTQGGPFMHVIAAKALTFHLALQPEFKTYQEQIIKNAQAMAQAFINYGYRIVAGGTDNHLFIIDLRTKGITGLEAERLLEQAGITVSRSTIPFDQQKPWITSGIRIGTPAMTTRGLKELEAQKIVALIDQVLTQKTSDILESTRKQIAAMLGRFPL